MTTAKRSATTKGQTETDVSAHPKASIGSGDSHPAVAPSCAHTPKVRVMEHCAGSNDDARRHRKVEIAGAPIYECADCHKLVRWQAGVFPHGKLRAHGRMLSAQPRP